MRITPFLLLVAFSVCFAGCGRKAEPVVPTPDLSVSDIDLLQGMWAIESSDQGDYKVLSEARKTRDAEMMKRIRFRFQGNKITVFGALDDQHGTFVLDEMQNPKQMTWTITFEQKAYKPDGKGGVTELSSKSVTKTVAVIYKFEKDSLVIAFGGDDEKTRPTEFKARYVEHWKGQASVSRVDVLTLKKTDVPAPPRLLQSTPTVKAYQK